MVAHDLRMINSYRTPIEPMKSFVDQMKALEGQNGILSVSMSHSFPYGDVADVGGKMLVVSDADAGQAEDLARELAGRVWAMRDQIAAPRTGIDEALDLVPDSPEGPVVLADTADNAGGGAPSDATFILQRVLDRQMSGVLSGLYWDPVAVRFCIEAGEGSALQLR